MSGAAEEQPVIEVRIAEPGPLGLTFAVLKAGDGPSHDFDLHLISNPGLLRASGSLAGSALGGLQLDDALWVTGVEASNTTSGKQYVCRTVDGAARILLVGDFSITLFDKSISRSGLIASHSIGDLMEWGVGPEERGQEEPYVFVTPRVGPGLKLRTSEPAEVCESIMEKAQQIAQLNPKRGGSKKLFLAQLRNATEIAWHGGARVNQRLVAVNGTAVETMAEVEACLQDAEDGDLVTTLTLRSGPIVVGNVDPRGTASQAEPDRLQCGLRLMAINGELVAGRSFSAMTKQIREDSRPLCLQLQAPAPVQPQVQRADSSDPEVSDGDRALLKHVEAAQIEHVTNGMVLAKRADTSYEEYLREKMPDDHNNEFVTLERKNERYHKMWDELTADSELTHEYTDPKTNGILDIDAIAAEAAKHEGDAPGKMDESKDREDSER